MSFSDDASVCTGVPGLMMRIESVGSRREEEEEGAGEGGRGRSE